MVVQHMVVALLSEKLHLLPQFLFNTRSWEGPKAGPDMAKVKLTVPDRYRTPVRLVIRRFLQPGKRRNNEASCYVLVPVFCFYHSDVQRFLPVTSNFCPPPQSCGRVCHTPIWKSWMWEAYVLWKSMEIWTVDEMWIAYELKGISHFRNWICLQFVLYNTCDYLSRMWSATDSNPDDRFQSGANRSVFSSQIATVCCEIWGYHIRAGCAGMFSRFEWWLVPDISSDWHLLQHGCILQTRLLVAQMPLQTWTIWLIWPLNT